MKIGIFDSGLGGLIITHALVEALPEYDSLYFGDTARVPYGNRSAALVTSFTQQAVDYLFDQGCGLIIVACNTASAEALRSVQVARQALPDDGRRVLGVLIPAAEVAVAAQTNRRIGVLATRGTVASGAFEREILKLDSSCQVFSQAAPLLVSLVEGDALKWADPILDEYLAPLMEQQIGTLVLGCTHYPFLKEQIRNKVGDAVRVLSQDEFIPTKLVEYLARHPELEVRLTRGGSQEYQVTDQNIDIQSVSKHLSGGSIVIKEVVLPLL